MMTALRILSKVAKVAILSVLVTMTTACSPSQKKSDMEAYVESTTYQEDEPLNDTCQEEPNLTDEEIKVFISFVPDHGLDNSPEQAFTANYYSLLTEAWAIPNDNPGGIGSGEWLYYFISGNGDGYDYIDIISKQMTGDKATVLFECRYNGSNEREKHRLNLVKEENGWVIEDFDNSLEQLARYIKDMRTFFRSNEWQELLRNSEYMNAEEKASANNEVKQYFQKYPRDRN